LSIWPSEIWLPALISESIHFIPWSSNSFPEQTELPQQTG
jgi:hypothetical protein